MISRWLPIAGTCCVVALLVSCAATPHNRSDIEYTSNPPSRDGSDKESSEEAVLTEDDGGGKSDGGLFAPDVNNDEDTAGQKKKAEARRATDNGGDAADFDVNSPNAGGVKIKDEYYDSNDGNPEARVKAERLRIREDLDRLGLPTHEVGAASTTSSTSGSETGAGAGPSCDQTCEISEAICVSQTAICQVADDYPDEPAFVDDCAWAQDACGRAQLLCTECENP